MSGGHRTKIDGRTYHDHCAHMAHHGVSSGFGRELTSQLLQRGDRVVGTVRDVDKVIGLTARHPESFHAEVLDVTDTAAIRDVVNRVFEQLGRVDVVVSDAGYGLFGAAEELTDAHVEHIIATNLTGSVQLIRSALPHLRHQGGGRIIQISSYGGQVAFPGNAMYHATKWGIEGFVEALAQEVTSFGIGVTIVEPGGAQTEFRYSSAQVAELMPEYDQTPAHSFLAMLDPANGFAPETRHGWQRASSRAWTSSPRRCGWSSARRRSRARSRC
jgi:NAD(P)-dependent dehydrogenase (short-subunit alcohol dehydrogenase family)